MLQPSVCLNTRTIAARMDVHVAHVAHLAPYLPYPSLLKGPEDATSFWQPRFDLHVYLQLRKHAQLFLLASHFRRSIAYLSFKNHKGVVDAGGKTQCHMRESDRERNPQMEGTVATT